MNWEVIGQEIENANIKVVGVGGAGGNAVKHMIENNIEGVEFICANTDTQALSQINCATTIGPSERGGGGQWEVAGGGSAGKKMARAWSSTATKEAPCARLASASRPCCASRSISSRKHPCHAGLAAQSSPSAWPACACRCRRSAWLRSSSSCCACSLASSFIGF